MHEYKQLSLSIWCVNDQRWKIHINRQSDLCTDNTISKEEEPSRTIWTSFTACKGDHD